MQLSQQDLHHLTQEAIKAAKKAGEYISSYTSKHLKVNYKPSTSDESDKVLGGSSLASRVFTEVDIKSQEIILESLSASIHQYDLALLTEEQVDDKSRLNKDYFWCIDPLDGTLPFTEGREGYSVSIALVSQQGIPHIGVIYDPVKKNIYYCLKSGGVYKNDQEFNISDKNQHFTLITDRSFTKEPDFTQVHNEIEAYALNKGLKNIQHINTGGAAMNAIWVLENSPACYFKFPKTKQGGGSIWDFAATTAIFNELKLPAYNIFGKPLDLNNPGTTFMNQQGVLFATDKSTQQHIQSIYAELRK
ncbi:inositol monophosphatase [Labilibacter sediminis]|nr:inositol monophosphatase [Labilibacter sediminis]